MLQNKIRYGIFLEEALLVAHTECEHLDALFGYTEKSPLSSIIDEIRKEITCRVESIGPCVSEERIIPHIDRIMQVVEAEIRLIFTQ